MGRYLTDARIDSITRHTGLSAIVPGLPHPVGSERVITIDMAWRMVRGSWSSWSFLQ